MLARLRDGAPEAHSRLRALAQRDRPDRPAALGRAGAGANSSTPTTARSTPVRASVDILDNAHNLPLHLAVELGIPAALLVCGGFGWLVLAARPWRETDPARLMAWAVLAVIVLHSLLEYPLWYGPFQLAFGLCLGLLWPARGAARRPSPDPARGRRPCALALLAVVGYAAWDYPRVSQVYLAPRPAAAGLPRRSARPGAAAPGCSRHRSRFARTHDHAGRPAPTRPDACDWRSACCTIRPSRR